MAETSISIQPTYGPSFVCVDGKDMFVHQADSRSCVGPREATKQDKANHPKLWAAYEAAKNDEHAAGIVGNAPGSTNAVPPDMPGFLKRKKGK